VAADRLRDPPPVLLVPTVPVGMQSWPL
jgi:hypothetical protein